METLEVLDKLKLDYRVLSDRASLCCPFHKENNPSFSIYLTTGRFKCFGCGKEGGLRDLVTGLTGSSWSEFSGVSFSKKEFFAPRQEKNILKDKPVDKTLNILGKWERVESSFLVKEFCQSIRFTSDFISSFEVRWFNHCKINEVDYYNRLAIPVYFQGELVNVELRDLTGRSPKKVLYPKGFSSDFLFNYENIDKLKLVQGVEGIKALASVWQIDKNVVSTFSKNIKPRQKSLIKQLEQYCIICDNDTDKIDKLTGLPCDTPMHMIKQFEEFYDSEYWVSEIPYKGKDPADLTLGQLQKVMDSKKRSVDFLMARSGLNISLLDIKKLW